MHRLKNYYSLLLMGMLILMVSGCATRYRPAEDGGYGYSHQALRPDVFLVKFQGNTSMDRETVWTLALYRASELTVQRGFNYFVLLNSEENKKSNGWFSSPYPQVQSQTAVPIARLKIQMRNGELPDNPSALDPNFILKTYKINE